MTGQAIKTTVRRHGGYRMLLALLIFCVTPNVVASWSVGRTPSGPGVVTAHGFRFAEPYFETVTDGDVIAGGVITALAQDAHGFLWIASQSGLMRYDGYQFRRFVNRVDDPGSLPGDYVQALLPRADGRLWVGSYTAGVALYDPAKRSFTRFQQQKNNPASLVNNQVWSLADDRAGGLWIGTDGGLDYLAPGSSAMRHLRHRAGEATSLRDDRVRVLLRDRDDRLWVGSAAGLQRLRVDGNGFDAVPQLDGKEIAALFQAADGKLWLGTREHGAAWLDPASLQLHWLNNPAGSVGQRYIHAIAQSGPDRIWLGTFGAGVEVVSAMDGRLLEHLRHDPAKPGSLAHDNLGALLQDRSGLLWLGTWGAGLQKIDARHGAVRTLRHSPTQPGGLSHPDVRSVLELENGQILIGSNSHGIDLFDRQRGLIGGYRPGGGAASRKPANRQGNNQSDNQQNNQPNNPANNPAHRPGSGHGSGHFDPALPDNPAGLPETAILAMRQTPDGTLWLATGQAGVLRLPKGGRQWLSTPGLPDVYVRRLLLAKDGSVWAGTRSGVARWQAATGRFEPVPATGGAPMQAFVTALEQDRAGRVWVGTVAGLWLWLPGETTLRAIPADPARKTAPSAGSIAGLLSDSRGNLWVGTERDMDRLVSWDGKLAHFEHVSQLARSASPFAGGDMLEDRQGRIWTSGLIYDPTSYTLYQLSRADGIELGANWLGSYGQTRDGLLLYGGTKGLLVIDPARFVPWKKAAPVLVTALFINGEEQALPKQLQLAHEQRDFALEFATCDFSLPKKIRYRYQLHGYDANWFEVDFEHRRVSYGNLAPGQYRLQLQASDRQGRFAGTPWQMDITVLPAWWQTGWFIGGMLLLLVTLGYLAWRFRVGQLKARAHYLEQVVEERTATIRSAHQELAESHRELAAAHRDMAAAHQHLQHTQAQMIQSEKMASLGQLVANVAHEINTPIGAIKASGDNIADAVKALLLDLPKLYALLDQPHQRLFQRMILHAQRRGEPPSSREERAMRREVEQFLQAHQLHLNQNRSAMLVQLHAHASLEEWLPLLTHREADFILKCAHGVALIINNTGNIGQAVTRVSKIVFALKSFTRKSATGKRILADLQDMLENVLTIYQSQLRLGTEVVRNYQPVSAVYCLPDELGQVWINLIHNALQAMDYRGTLTLGLDRVDDWARVSVSDTGCGIDEAIRERIFEPFFTTRAMGQGSGLGLDIVRKIVEQHGGRIEIDSQPGVGSTFAVYLPLGLPPGEVPSGPDDGAW